MPVVTLYPTSNAVVTTGWTSPTNAYTGPNAGYATAAPGKNASITSRFGGFDLSSIGSRDTINSVTVHCVFKVSTQSSIGNFYWQPYTGGAVVGAEASNTAEPLADTDVSSSQWTLAAPDLLAADFGINVRANRGSSNTTVTFSLDVVYIVVDSTVYVPPAGPPPGFYLSCLGVG